MIELNRDDNDKIKMLIKNFRLSSRDVAEENIAVEFLKYLANEKVKINDGMLINEILDEIL